MAYRWSSREMLRFRLLVPCVSVALNAVTASGVLTFPIMSPILASRMKFTQPQLTSIVLAGMTLQYPLAPIVGKIVDHYGPWSASLIASLLFSLAFGLCAWEVDTTQSTITSPSVSSFRRFVLYFALAGLGGVFSYFSALFTASKTFPEWIGIASALPMLLFGLSPLFLSLFASHSFTDHDTGLNIVRYFVFLALLCGFVNFLGAFVLHVPRVEVTNTIPDSELESESESDETAALIAGTPGNVTLAIVPIEEPKQGTVLDLLRDPYFWILAIYVSFIVGSCEMVMSNIGSITLSLPPISSPASDPIVATISTSEASIATQVQLISIFNAVSRIVVGPLADYLSPAATYVNGTFCVTRKHRASRVLYLSIGALILAVAFLWMELGVRSQSAVWTLSVSAGTVNGIVFTILPSILSSLWGLPNLARNFGVASYAVFIGTPIFSLLYSFVSESHSYGGHMCQGADCWRATFWVNTGAAIISFLTTILLWRRWRWRI